ncbi:MAG: ATP-binding cassette domain-containing protein [Candidatus Izemoplasmatales bacterium]
MKNAIEVLNLTKNYKQVQAVKGISFQVKQGTLFAFLGPNGAGKSTTINVVCSLLSFDQGEINILGNHVGKDDAIIRQKIGIVFQNSVLDDRLSIEENLQTRGKLYGMNDDELNESIKRALEIADIYEIRKRRFGKLSGGQKRRADIARALIHQPEILFLDEPTTGLDPQTRKNVWSTIQSLQKNTGMTVFLTTHYLEEANEADEVVVIDHGEIVAKGTPSELKNTFSHDRLEINPKDQDKVLKLLGDQVQYEVKNDIILIPLSDTLDAYPLLKLLEGEIISFQVLNGSLDDAFITITGEEMRS